MADKIQASGEIAKDFYLVNQGFVCLYVLRVEGGLVAFDAGMKPAAVAAELSKLKLDPNEVTHVFLTHTDMDHVGGLGAFPRASVHLPADEVAMIERRQARFFGLIYNRPLAAAYDTLRDGQEVAVGGAPDGGGAIGVSGGAAHVLGGSSGAATDARGGATIRCISTPGHTSGSMSYLVNGTILIVGDELNLKEGKAVLDRGMIAVDNAKRRESIGRIAALAGVTHLCTMHSGYTADFERAVKDWRS